jgi:hypothetical protein
MLDMTNMWEEGKEHIPFFFGGLWLCIFLFNIFLACALFSGDVAAMHNTCEGLWTLLLTRFLLGFPCFLFFSWSAFWNQKPNRMWIYRLYMGSLVVFALAEILVIPRDTIQNMRCTNLLRSNNPLGGNSPLLSILGWIILSMDWCMLLLLLMYMILNMEYNCHNDKNNDNNQEEALSYYDEVS